MNEEYIKRINSLLTYIDNNLSADLSLDTLAPIAFYSPFHLHRLFKAITNETLNSYVTRKRIEKAALFLMHKSEVSISELVFQFGFSSNSSFTRAFKKYYAQSPSNFRKSNFKPNSKNGKMNTVLKEYLCSTNQLNQKVLMNARIEIKELPKTDWAYITQIGVEGLEDAYNRLLQWAGSKGLLNENLKMGRIYHDSFKITEPNKVRMSCCLLLHSPVEVGGEVGLVALPKGKHIVARFEIVPDEFGKNWQSLFVWMNENGHKKSDQNPFEIMHNDFKEHPEKKCVVDFCIPIE